MKFLINGIYQRVFGKGEATYSTLSLQYNHLEDLVKTNSSIVLETEKEDKKAEEKQAVATEERGIEEEGTEETEDLVVDILPKTDGKEMESEQEVYEGQGIQYVVKITNQSESKMENIHVKAVNTNAIYFGEVKYDFEYGIKDIITKIEEDEKLEAKEFDIESLEAGQTIELSYHIAVKEVEGTDKTVGGEIIINGDDIEEKRYEIPEAKIKQAELKLTFSSEYPEEIKIISKEAWALAGKVKNISSKELNDVIVEFPIAEEFQFETDEILIEEESGYEFLDYENNLLRVKIPKLEVGKDVSIYFKLLAKSIPKDQEKISSRILFHAKVNEQVYTSNELEKDIYQGEPSLSVVQTSNIDKKMLQDGDHLSFTITLKNEGIKEALVIGTDNVPDGLEVHKTYYIEDGEKHEIELISNSISQSFHLAAGETITWVIDTVVDTSLITTDTVTNYATVNGIYVDIKTNEITYQIEKKEDLDPEDPDNPNNPNNPGNPGEKDVFSISGEVWNDENKNGLKESFEKRMSDISVILLNEVTGDTVSTRTDEEGSYEFAQLLPDHYLVILQYDTATYYLTEYQKNRIGESMNSDFISKNITLQGQEWQVAITGSINLQNQDIKNVDAGFIKGENFDLKVNKYIGKIMMQSAKETIVKEYNRQQLAKAELDAKKVNNTNIILEYRIEITNQGEVAGYASEIVDHMPKNLDFSSEINKSWYKGTDGSLYTKQLADQMIQPGETKMITLILTKNMTQDNTGTIANTAEISKSSNEFVIKDRNKNNDKSKAEVILSIRTGRMVQLILISLISIVIIGIGTIIIKRKVL